MSGDLPCEKTRSCPNSEALLAMWEGQELALNVQYKLMAHNILNRENFHRQQVSDVEAKILIKWSHGLQFSEASPPVAQRKNNMRAAEGQ